MDIRLEMLQSTLVVKIAGEIDHHSAGQIRETIDSEIERKRVKNLVFDFDRVTFMDSSGIGVIIGRYKQVRAQGGKTLIIRAKPQVERLLEISGIKKIIETNGNDIAL